MVAVRGPRGAAGESDRRAVDLHNDSTPVSFFGAYLNAAMERRVLGRPTLAITFGHSKHRAEVLITELTHVQRRLLNLLGLPPKHYGQ